MFIFQSQASIFARTGLAWFGGGGELLLSSSSLYVVSRLPEPLGRDSSLRDAQKSRLESRGLPCEVLGATLTPAKS